jgi:hypothetical protein
MYRIALIVIAVVFTAAVPRASAQDSASRRPREIGRYQLCATNSGLFLIDTATGQCWIRMPDGQWRDDGSPADAARDPAARRAKGAPPTLELAGSSEMTIVQREERAIPGSDGTVRIRLGDITEGQVLLAIVTADDDHLLETTSVEQGEEVEFSVGGKRYVVHVAELRNVVLGDDFATITIAEAAKTR